MKLYIGSQISNRPYGILTVEETQIIGNSSYLTITLTLKRPIEVTTAAVKSASCVINGTTYTWNGAIDGIGDKILIYKAQTVEHNNAGAKTIDISASIALNMTWNGAEIGTISAADTMALTPISRYATVFQSLASRTENAVEMAWNSDSNIDYIWYSLDSETWTGAPTEGKSGTYTVGGLMADTEYAIITRVRRKDSQLTTDSDPLTVRTYSYPFCNDMPNFRIGDKLTLGFYNPLFREITVKLIGADMSIIQTDVINGEIISGYDGATAIEGLLGSLPDSSSGIYQVSVIYDEHSETREGGTYTVNSAPTIESVRYADINPTTLAITADDQEIIQNQSTVRFTAEGLLASDGATLTGCTVNINGNIYDMTLDGSSATVGNIVIDSAADINAIFTVTDSRGLTSTKGLTVSILSWSLPSAIINCNRQNNYYSSTEITVNADYSSLHGYNSITIQCRYKKTTDADYGNYQGLQDGVTTVLVLDNDYNWNVQVLLTDIFGSTTYDLVVLRGMPILFIDKLLNSVGINCFPTLQNDVAANGRSLIRSIITASLSADVSNLTRNTYNKIPLDLSSSVNDRLSLTQDGGILIGAGVSEILVSGRICYHTLSAGDKDLRITKNTSADADTIAWVGQDSDGDDYMTLTPTLATVQEGDIIYLYYHTGVSTDTVGGNAFGSRTSLTVETV